MKVMCAWCKKEMSDDSVRSATDDRVSHGICLVCADNIYFQEGVKLERYLDSLPHPIAVLNEEGRVVTVNSKVLSFVHKDLPTVKGMCGGDVFECQYSRLPEGCGKTLHCSGCTIRRTVTETYMTGRGVYQRKALLSQDVSSKFYLLISTEKVAETVFLRIDEMNRCQN